MHSNIKYELKPKIANNFVIQAMLRKARNLGFAEIYITGLESWNNTSWDDQGNVLHREGPPWDISGHTWTDIEAIYYLRRWHPKDLFRILRSWIKAIRDYGFKRAWKYSPLQSKRQGWVWTVESLDCVKSDLADEYVSEHLMPDQIESKDWIDDMIELPKGLYQMRPLSPLQSDQIKKRIELTKELITKITKQEVLISLLKSHTKVSDWMYLLNEDPTVIVVDQEMLPFDLKDGWSNNKIVEILQEWFKVFGYGYPLKQVSDEEYEKN